MLKGCYIGNIGNVRNVCWHNCLRQGKQDKSELFFFSPVTVAKQSEWEWGCTISDAKKSEPTTISVAQSTKLPELEASLNNQGATELARTR